MSYLAARAMVMTIALRSAELHGGQYVKTFAREMWMQLGMRVLVFSGHHDTEGTLSLAV